MVTGRISFVGAGPGAADLITLRGAKRIAEADIVVWTASLVTPECVQEHARSDAELVDSSRLTHEQAVEIFRRAERDKLTVARVHSGDPSLWGGVQEQHDAAARMNVEVEIVPGVPAFSAAAAAIGRELTVPEVAQSLVLTRLEGAKTAMPDGETVREFARHGTTMALFLSAARTSQLVEELRAGGYPDDTPVLVAYKVTWPDELLVRSTLGELEADCKKHKLWRHTLFIIGKGLNAGGSRAHSYHSGQFHSYRKPDREARRPLRTERPVRRADTAKSGESRRADIEKPGESRRADTAKSGESRRADTEKPGEPHRVDIPSAKPAEGDSGKLKESDAAWWAVRDWQESARGAARFGANRTISIREADESQSQLFGTDEAGEPEPAAPQQESSSSSGTATTRTTAKAGTARKQASAAKSSTAKRKAPAKPSAGKSKQTTKRKPPAKPDDQSE